jgi:hypothetical protein
MSASIRSHLAFVDNLMKIIFSKFKTNQIAFFFSKCFVRFEFATEGAEKGDRGQFIVTGGFELCHKFFFSYSFSFFFRDSHLEKISMSSKFFSRVATKDFLLYRF